MGSTRVTKLAGDVELYLWDGGCAFIGSSSRRVPVHSHQAIQLTFGREGRVRLSPAEDGPWTSYALGVVGSHQPHTLDALEVPLGAVLFIEPETREGRALTERCRPDGFASLDPGVAAGAMAELFERFLARRGEAAVVGSARRIVTLLTDGVEHQDTTDGRIVRALAWINAHIREPITLEAVAETVFLSPSRFRHLFVEQMGMGLRPYLLWRRFMRTWEMIMAGASISKAAHEAGFADAAHFTRTSNRMIGVAPSLFRVSHSPAALRPAPSRAAKP